MQIATPSLTLPRKRWRESRQRFNLILAVIVLTAAVLRLVELGQYPQRFNQDEMAQGYDAWSIWRTGRDQHGNPFPLQFRNFNDYIPPVANYITAPFVGLLGMDETTTRLPVALFSIATIALVGLLGRLWFGEIAGLAAALLLTFEPWHVNYSRIAFPAGFVPFFTVVALYTYTHGVNLLAGSDQPTLNPKTEDKIEPPRRRERQDYTETFYRTSPEISQISKQRRSLYWLAASALSFVLLTMTYSTMKMEAPLLIAACVMASAFVWWRNWRIGIIWLLLIALFMSPYAIDIITHWQITQGRFDAISLFREANWMEVWWANYRAHYDLQAWFIDGLKSGVAVHPVGIGELFWLEAPLMLIAVSGLLRHRFWQRSQLMIPVLVIIWLLIFPLAASLTNQGIPHEIRTYNLLPLPELLAGYGLALIREWGAAAEWKRAITYVLIGITFFVFGLFNISFLTYYFGPSLWHIDPPGQEVYHNIGLRPVLEKVHTTAQPCDIIWVDRMGEPYIYYLFLTRTPPEQFQNARTEKNEDLWLNIKWLNNVRFGAPDFDQIDAPPIPDCDGQPSQTYFVTRRPTLTEGWQDFFATHNDAGNILWRAMVQPTLSN